VIGGMNQETDGMIELERAELLRERIKDLEDTLTNTRAERDAARGNWAFEQKRVAELEAQNKLLSDDLDANEAERDRLRAENEAREG